MDDAALLASLRAGDEDAFAAIVRQYHAPLVRLAESMVPSRAVAEEVVQDTWLGVVRGVAAFEGRSSFRTWLFHILANRARSAGVREHRSAPVEPDTLSDRFDRSGAWAEPPAPWTDDTDARVDAVTLAARVKSCLPRLPGPQRQVVLLRDVEGLPAADVCAMLGISDGHQRVLLHRGRTALRRLLAEELGKS